MLVKTLLLGERFLVEQTCLPLDEFHYGLYIVRDDAGQPDDEILE